MQSATRVLIALVLLLCPLAFTQTAPNLTTTEIAPNFFRIEAKADDFEIAVYTGGEKLVVIDTGLAPSAAKLRDAVRAVSAKPIGYVVLTHFHFDHVGGAEFFAKEAPIVAHANTRKRMQLPTRTAWRNDPPAPASALPLITFDKQLTLYMGDEEIQLIALTAHTDTDVAIWFKKTGVVHFGDAILGVDNDAGGDTYGMAEAAERIGALVPPETKILISHAGLASVGQVRDRGKRWREAASIIDAAIRAGKTLEQVKAEHLLEPLFKRGVDRVAETLYRNLSQRRP